MGLGIAGGLAGGGGGEPVDGEGGLGRGDDLGMVGEPEVVAASEGEVGMTVACRVNAGDVGCCGGLGRRVWHC